MTGATFSARAVRAWVAIYTFGLPKEIRSRRGEEIESDLWEHEHDDPQAFARSAFARLVTGAPADFAWRADELGGLMKMRLNNFAIDRRWDLRMRLLCVGAAAVFVATVIPVAVGLPVLFALTMPIAIVALALEVRKLRAASEKTVTIEIDSTKKRRRLALVVAASASIAIVGGIIDRAVNQKLHDSWWFLFVAPMMIGMIVAVVALLMLGWAFLPRREPTAT